MIAVANKYHARRALGWGGRMYDSTAERDYANELGLRAAAGDVSAVQMQPVIPLVAGITYRPDFAFTETTTARRVFVDVKGVETDRFRIIVNLWRVFGPGVLQIVKRDGRKRAFRVVREVAPQGEVCDGCGRAR